MWEVGISILIVGAIWLFHKLSETLASEHSGLKLLFLLMSCWLVVLSSSVAINIAEGDDAGSAVLSNLQTFYKVLLWTTIFVTGYFIIYFVYRTFMGIPLPK